MPYDLRVLGPPELLLPNGLQAPLPLGKPLGLLIHISCSQTPLTRDDVAELFWPDTPRERARHSVRQALWILKTTVGEDLFEADAPLTLKEGVLRTDLDAFRQALQEGRIDDARGLWRGPFLEGLVLPGLRSWQNRVEDLRTDLDLRFHRALLLRAEELRRGGGPQAALSHLEAALQILPSGSEAHEIRIELLVDLLRLDEAREAIADAFAALGDDPAARAGLRRLEARVATVARGQRARLEAADAFGLEFVGRSKELAILRRSYEEALSGRACAVVITGPAGIGKTRLAEEFVGGTAGEDVRVVSVIGSRGEMRLRWGGVANLVRQLLVLPGSAGISPASDSLLRAMIPSLGRGIVNLETVNGVSPVALLDAVTDLLEAVSFEAPLAVLLDDYQWMDGESRTLLLALIRRAGRMRTLFLVSGRPDLSSGSWREVQVGLARDAHAPCLTLENLRLEEVRELLGLISEFPDPGDAERVVQRIHQVSNGNPLFIQGLLRELHEQGIFRRGEGAWIFQTDKLPLEFNFPEDIKTLLGERLHRLSEGGARLAAALAARGKPTSPHTLRAATGMDEVSATEGVTELLDREVVRWFGGEKLDFCHELLREASLAQLPPGRSGWPLWKRWRRDHPVLSVLAAGIALALPLGIFWGGGESSGESSGEAAGEASAEPPLYGGGMVLFDPLDGAPQAFEVGAGPPEEWVPALLEPNPPQEAWFFDWGSNGELLWFGQVKQPDGPDIVQILPDGTSIPLFPGVGDQAFQDLSPDGTRLLFRSENTDRERFGVGVYWGRIGSEEKHLIFDGDGPVGFARWSPDGDLVALNIPAREDTLAIFSLTGDRVGSVALGEVHGISWCDASVVVAATPEDRAVLMRLSVPEMTVDTIAPLAGAVQPECSPDGSAVVYTGVVGGRLAPVVRDLETREVHVLSGLSRLSTTPTWLPEGVSVVPSEVRASLDTVRIGWGEKRPLSAVLVSSDGSKTEGGIRWESMNPNIATVNSHQELTGNGTGSTRLLARWGFSLADTVSVTVEDEGTGGALLRERFEQLDSTRWTSYGEPKAQAVLRDGEPALQLFGDEKYREGVLYRPFLSFDRGITVELDLRMAVNREVHQSFSLCLYDMEEFQADLEIGTFQHVHEAVCFQYPSREFERRDLSEGSLVIAPGLETKVRLPETFPPLDWTHVAVQVRPDGQATLVVNREVVAVSPLRVSIQPQDEWRLLLDGDAVGTEIFLRNLSIWAEVRYADETVAGIQDPRK